MTIYLPRDFLLSFSHRRSWPACCTHVPMTAIFRAPTFLNHHTPPRRLRPRVLRAPQPVADRGETSPLVTPTSLTDRRSVGTKAIFLFTWHLATFPTCFFGREPCRPVG